MELTIYLRNMDSEYPIEVLEKRSKKYWDATAFGFDAQQYWSADWAAPWQGEYRRGYATSNQSDNVSLDSIIGRIHRWIVRREEFGGLFYEKDTDTVFKGDNEALEFVIAIQKNNERDSVKIDSFVTSFRRAMNA